MENIIKELVPFLQYLIPGFLTAWIFYGFTSFLLPSQFERIVQALILTVFIQLLVYIEQSAALIIGNVFSIGHWTKYSELACSFTTAFFLGTIFAYFSNNDKFHKFARKLNITKETSYPSEWFGAFNCNLTYIVLHLDDDRRLYGWPKEWPSEPDRGHFVIEDASWLVDPNEANSIHEECPWLDKDDDKKYIELPLTGVSAIMVNAKVIYTKTATMSSSEPV